MRKKLIYDLVSAVVLLLSSCGGEKDNPVVPAVPSAPSGITLHSSSENALTFQWNAVEGATGYLWQISRDGKVEQEGKTLTRNVTVSGLAKATAYRFGVQAQGEGGVSGWSYADATTAGSVDPGPGPSPTPSGIEYSEFRIPAAEEDGVARAFPGAEGGGMYTTGGRGGKVLHVTNLNDSGEGSFRWAVTQSGARTVVFDVAGTIDLQSRIQIKNGDLTIAGQTAPGDGICLRNYTVNIAADNVIIRFLHFRLGDQGPNAGDSEDCIWGRYQSRIILDHCSMSWSIDECASFYGNEFFTLQWCLLTESMNDSAHSKGAHGYGGIWGGKDASFHHNLLSNHHSRNPRIDHPEIYPRNGGEFDWSKRGNVDLRNLVIYNWGDNSTYGGEGGRFNLVNNFYKPGPSSKDRYYFVDAYSVYSSSKVNYGYPGLYMDGNIHTGHDDLSDNNLVHGVYFHEASSYTLPSGYSFQQAAYPLSGPDSRTVYTTTHDAEAGKDAVLSWAGDRLHRDSVDDRAVEQFRTNTGKIINTPADVGGWPGYSASAQELSAVKDSDGDGIPDAVEEAWGMDKADAADGAAVSIDPEGRYSNLEMYLHYLVRDIVAGGNEKGTYVKL